MEINNIINTLDNQQITEEELSAIYYYISYAWEDMSQEDQQFWIAIINTIDPW